MYCIAILTNCGTHVSVESAAFGITINAPDAMKAVSALKSKLESEAVLILRNGGTLPEERFPEELPDRSCVIEIDPETALKRSATQTVKRTISIPEWMDVKIKEEKINASQFFQSKFDDAYGNTKPDMPEITDLESLKKLVPEHILKEYLKESLSKPFSAFMETLDLKDGNEKED